MHRRLASGRAPTWRKALLWAPPFLLTALVGAALGGCPGPDPREGGSGGQAPGSNASSSVGSGQGGTTSAGGGFGGETSATGVVDAGCGPDMQVCGDRCTDTDSDKDNCGKCGNVCPTNNVVDPGCSGGKCKIQCVAGFVNLDPSMGQNCDTPAKRVFVTNLPVDAKFNSMSGGVHAANTLCSQRAQLGGLGNTSWVAWIATQDSMPESTVISGFTGAYVLANGLTVVATAAELVTGPLRHPIDMTEGQTTLDAVADTHGVWTGTDASGSATMNDCSGWTQVTNQFIASVGDWSSTNAAWTTAGASPCTATQRVYCFEH